MAIKTKARRSKVTKLDIARAREEILAQPKPAKQTIERPVTEPKADDTLNPEAVLGMPIEKVIKGKMQE